MADRFDLENAITRFYALQDDLDAIAEGLIEDTITKDEATNALLGVGVLTRLLTDKAFEIFKAVFRLDNYREDWAQRYSAADTDPDDFN